MNIRACCATCWNLRAPSERMPYDVGKSSFTMPRDMPANDSQTAAIDNEIAHLRGLDLDGLRARWRPRPASPSEPRRRSGRGDGPWSCRGRRALLPGPDRRAPAAAESSGDAAGPSFRSGCASALASRRGRDRADARSPCRWQRFGCHSPACHAALRKRATRVGAAIR
jgi:hypothetical protein